MVMDYVRFALCVLCVVIGLFLTFVGVFGFYKFKFILNRMHSAAIIDTLGLFFIVLGLVIAYGFPVNDGVLDLTSIKLCCVVLFLWLTSPVCSHIIAKLIYMTDAKTDSETKEVVIDEKGQVSEHD